MKKYIWVILLAVIIIVIMILSLLNAINELLGMSIALFLIDIFCIIVAIIAFKKDVKLIGLLMSIFTIIGIILTILSLCAYFKMNNNSNYKFQITVEPEESEKNFLFSYENHDYYTYNVKNVEVIMKKDGKSYSLEDALNNKLITLDEILTLAIPNENTIGYKIYYDGGQEKYKNDEYSITLCENDKNDVIFSTFNYTYEETICK